MQGSALNPADLERARINKAKAVIILAKPNDSGENFKSQSMMDADVIFMYKTMWKCACRKVTGFEVIFDIRP